MQAFAHVLAACPAYQRARMTHADLDPEDATIFQAEIIALHATFAPFDPYEWSIIADIGRSAAEAARAQRMVTALVHGARRTALAEVLRPILKDHAHASLDAVVDGYLARRSKDVTRVEAALAHAGLSASVVSARARLHHEDSIVQLERTIDASNKRKNRLVQDLKKGRSKPVGCSSMAVRPPDAPAERAGGDDGR